MGGECWGSWGCEEDAGGGAVCRRGLRRGLVSRPFRAADLLRALHAAPTTHATVFVETDAAGYLCARGAGCGGVPGGAAVTARAALAASVPATTALLTPAPRSQHTPYDTTETLLQLRVETGCAPHAALRVWLDERLRAALGVPHLALNNIRGEKEYACHVCGARFPEPNPLKAHLFLQCAAPVPQRFWRRVVARLQAAAAAEPEPEPEPEPDPARLEALAAEWGARARLEGGAHACIYCGKLYSRKYGLKIHIRTHTGYRPLRCRHCARAFGDPSNLNKHVRLHAARDPALHAARDPALHDTARLACPACGKALARRRDLERHLRTHSAAASSAPDQLVQRDDISDLRNQSSSCK